MLRDCFVFRMTLVGVAGLAALIAEVCSWEVHLPNKEETVDRTREENERAYDTSERHRQEHDRDRYHNDRMSQEERDEYNARNVM